MEAIPRRRVLDTGIGHDRSLRQWDPFDGTASTQGTTELSISWPVLLYDVVPMQLVQRQDCTRQLRPSGNSDGGTRILAMLTPISIQSYTAKVPKPNPTYSDLRDGTICAQKSCVLGRVFTHSEPLDFCTALADHRAARFSELLAALLKTGVECSSRLDAIAFGEPRTHFGTGVISEVVEPRFVIYP
jgi:hypothetical protein